MKYLTIVLLFSHLYGVNPATPYCIIQTESSYVHIKGDGGFAHGFGMMHTAAIKDTCKYLNLNCKNIRAIKRRMQRDNRFAIRMSMAYYKTLLDYFKGNETLAIMAYQAGPGSIDAGLYNWTYFAKVKSCILSSQFYDIDNLRARGLKCTRLHSWEVVEIKKQKTHA